MSGRFWLIVLLTMIAVLLIGKKFLSPGGDTNLSLQYNHKLQVGEAIVSVQIADDPQEMELGLGGRSQLDDGQGMVFLYPTAVTPRYWMKNMQFPIDFVWVLDGIVVDITQNAEPQPGASDADLRFYTPKIRVDLVLEVPSFYTQRAGIAIGDRVVLHR